MPNIRTFDAGDLSVRPTEVGVEARAATARRVGMFYNQQAAATDMLASETARLAGETKQLGGETEQLGSFKGQQIAQAGRAISGGIEAAGDAAVKYLDHQQISAGQKAWSGLLMNTTQAWNDTVKNADPNDPTVAQKFMDQLDQRLEQFKGDGFYTEGAQKWAEAHTEALRQHFAEKTTADMATLAGHAAKVNTQQTINQLSSTVHSDPSSLDFSLRALESSTEGMLSTSPNLSGTQAGAVRSEILQKGKEAIVKSAAIGYIEKTAKIPPWATDPKYAPYIDGAELKMLEKAAKTQAKANELTEKQLQTYAKQQADLAVHTGANKIMADNVTIDPATNRPIINPQYFNQVLDLARKYPGAPSAATTARTLLDWGEHQQNVKASPIVSDPVVRQGLVDRMFATDNPTTTVDIMRAEVQGKLSKDDSASMRRLVGELEQSPLKGDVWKSTMAAAKDQLIVQVPGIPGKDDVGIQNYAKFVQSFVPQYLAASRAGTLQPNALDTNDPKSMISQAMAPFKRSKAQRMQDYVAGMGGISGQGEQVLGVQTTNLPPAPPPQRTIGQLYDTPRGKMKWTGTGWVSP